MGPTQYGAGLWHFTPLSILSSDKRPFAILPLKGKILSEQRTRFRDFKFRKLVSRSCVGLELVSAFRKKGPILISSLVGFFIKIQCRCD